MKVIRENTIWLSVLICSFLIVCAVFITRQYAVSAADSSGTYGSGSYGRIAMANTDALNNMGANHPDDIELGSLITNPQTAGGFIGYTGAGLEGYDGLYQESGVTLTYVGANTKTAVIYEYAKLTDESGFPKAAGQYIMYGRMLQGLGLDQTLENGFGTGLRKAAGIAVLGVYILGNFVNQFFDFVLGILNYANPFYLFKEAGDTGIQAYSAADIGTEYSSVTEAMGNIAKTVGSFYDLLHKNAVTLFLPLLLVCSLFMWLVIKKGAQPFAVFKNLIVRALFTTIGVALLASVYTTALGLVQNMNITNDDAMKQAVAATFFDFNKLVYEKGLDLDYNGIKLGSIDDSCFSKGVPTDDYAKLVRAATLKLNGGDNDSDAIIGAHGLGDFDSFLIGTTGTAGGSSGSNDGGISNDTVIDLLERYAAGTKVKAAGYESSVKAGILSSGGSADEANRQNAISDLWMYYSESQSESKDIAIAQGTNIKTEYTDGGSRASWYMWTPQNGGMAPIAIYNYLSSVFKENELIVYSNETGDELAKGEHFAVNIGGNSVMQFVYLADLLCLLLCVSIIGYSYGLGLLLANFKAMIKFIPSVFTGVLGSLRGIASAIIIILALVIEILGTCVIYNIGTMIMVSVYKIIEFPIAEIFGSLQGVSGGLFSIVTGALSCFIMIQFMKKMIDYRHAVCLSITDMCTSTINKFLGTTVENPNISTKPDAVTSAVGAAAMVGVGLANASGVDGSDVNSESSSLAHRMAIVGHNMDGQSSESSESSSESSTDLSEKDKNKSGLTGGSDDDRDASNKDKSDELVSEAGGDEWSADSKNPENYNQGSGTGEGENAEAADGSAGGSDSDGSKVDADGAADSASADEGTEGADGAEGEAGEAGEDGEDGHGDLTDKTNDGVTSPANDPNHGDTPYIATDVNGQQYQIVGESKDGSLVARDSKGNLYNVVDSTGKNVSMADFEASDPKERSTYSMSGVDGKIVPLESAGKNANYIAPGTQGDFVLSDDKNNRYVATRNADGSFSVSDPSGEHSFTLSDSNGNPYSGVSMDSNGHYTLKTADGQTITVSGVTDMQGHLVSGNIGELGATVGTAGNGPTYNGTGFGAKSSQIIAYNPESGETLQAYTSSGSVYTAGDFDKGSLMTFKTSTGEVATVGGNALENISTTVVSQKNGTYSVSGFGQDIKLDAVSNYTPSGGTTAANAYAPAAVQMGTQSAPASTVYQVGGYGAGDGGMSTVAAGAVALGAGAITYSVAAGTYNNGGAGSPNNVTAVNNIVNNVQGGEQSVPTGGYTPTSSYAPVGGTPNINVNANFSVFSSYGDAANSYGSGTTVVEREVPTAGGATGDNIQIVQLNESNVYEVNANSESGNSSGPASGGKRGAKKSGGGILSSMINEGVSDFAGKAGSIFKMGATAAAANAKTQSLNNKTVAEDHKIAAARNSGKQSGQPVKAKTPKESKSDKPDLPKGTPV